MFTGVAVILFASALAMWINDHTRMGVDPRMDDLGE
jgi:hypothetical protein